MNFFKQFLKSAKYTGAIAPSTPFLARKMVSLANIGQADMIIELGPGSGAVTKEIMKAKPPKSRLVTIDINQEFVAHLKKEYPLAEHIHADIQHMEKQLAELGIRQADIIISGIPFVDFKDERCHRMLSQINGIMHERSSFVLFTYTPIKFKTFYQWFDKVDMSYVPLNIPPAYVLLFRKKPVSSKFPNLGLQ